jgi:thiol-disulfide isomerase/thioredoxin
MRLIKLFLSVSVLCLLYTACNNSGFTVNGVIQNMPEQKVYLEKIGANNNDLGLLDSTTTNKDGSFKLASNLDEPTLVRLRFGMGKYIMLVQHKGKTNVSADWNAMEDYIVTDNEASITLKGFLVQLREYLKDVNTMDYITKNVSKEKVDKDSLLMAIKADLQKINSTFVGYTKQFVDTTKYLPNAVFAVNILSSSTEGAFIKNFYDNLDKRYPTSQLAKDFKALITPKYDSIVKTTVPDNYAKKDDGTYVVTPGDAPIATAFSAATPDGKVIELSSYKGKYVLVDFWASWCGPCRQENPNVLSAYRQYKDKNFDILGVSLDDDKANWVKAIKDDGLVWTQISELKKWGSIIARDYKINSIPANFLINPEGKIIAKNLRGSELEAKLAQIFK